jgi:hypothetical protein
LRESLEGSFLSRRNQLAEKIFRLFRNPIPGKLTGQLQGAAL